MRVVDEIQIVTTKKRQVVDITEKIEKFLSETKQNTGVCFIFAKHTTCGLTTADLDPGTDLDMLDAFEKIVPKLDFRHPHDPKHVHEHIISSLLGASVVVPYKNAKLILGTWQRVVLIEMSGPRTRNIVIKAL